jgi:branched-chain amino acid transport system substrate-binding protein
MKITGWVAAVLLFGSAAIAGLKAEELRGEAIKIGAIIPLTGGGASLGRSELNGAMLAVKQINGNGGINGRPISIIHEDDRTNADTAISKANDLIYGQKVVALIGPGQTANTVAVGGITDPLKIPVFAYSGLGPEVEKTRKCVLHMAPAQDLNAKAMLSYAKSIGIARVGVLYDSGFGTVVFSQNQQVCRGLRRPNHSERKV